MKVADDGVWGTCDRTALIWINRGTRGIGANDNGALLDSLTAAS